MIKTIQPLFPDQQSITEAVEKLDPEEGCCCLRLLQSAWVMEGRSVIVSADIENHGCRGADVIRIIGGRKLK